MTYRQQEKKKENFKPKTFQLFASHLSQINILKCCLTFLSSLTWQSQFLEIWFLLLSPQALNTIRLTSYYASVVVVRTNLICYSGMFLQLFWQIFLQSQSIENWDCWQNVAELQKLPLDGIRHLIEKEFFTPLSLKSQLDKLTNNMTAGGNLEMVKYPWNPTMFCSSNTIGVFWGQRPRLQFGEPCPFINQKVLSSEYQSLQRKQTKSIQVLNAIWNWDIIREKCIACLATAPSM